MVYLVGVFAMFFALYTTCAKCGIIPSELLEKKLNKPNQVLEKDKLDVISHNEIPAVWIPDTDGKFNAKSDLLTENLRITDTPKKVKLTINKLTTMSFSVDDVIDIFDSHKCKDEEAILEKEISLHVKKMYSEGQTVGKIIDWINTCQNVENKIFGLLSLKNEIQNNKDDDFAKWMLQFVEASIPPGRMISKMDYKYRFKYFQLILGLPYCMFKVLRESDGVLMRSPLYRDFLYAENGTGHFVVAKDAADVTDGAIKWYPEIVKYDDGATLMFRNVEYNEYLTAGVDLDSNGSHYVLVKNEAKNTEWVLVRAENLDECYLKDVSTGAYLCIEKDIQGQRKAFTKVLNTIQNDNCPLQFEVQHEVNWRSREYDLFVHPGD